MFTHCMLCQQQQHCTACNYCETQVFHPNDNPCQRKEIKERLKPAPMGARQNISGITLWSMHIFILHPGAQLNMFSVNICCTLHCALHCTAADLPNARYNFGVIWLKGSTESIFDTDWMGGKSVCSAAGCKSNQTVSNHFLIFYGCFFYLYICAKFNFKVRGPFVTIVCLRSTRKSNHSHTNIWNFEVCGLRRGVVASSSSSRGR